MKPSFSLLILLAGMSTWGCNSEDSSGGATGGAAGSTASNGGSVSAGGNSSVPTSGMGGSGGDTSTPATTAATVLAPVDGTAWTTACADPAFFVARGGSVAEDAADVRVSARRSVDEIGYGDVQMGFRCVTTGTPDTALGEWASIPAGTFVMGCSPGDTACKSSEYPVHSVTIGTAFSMMKNEVSVAMAGGTSNFAVRMVPHADATQFCADHGGRLPTEAEWEYAARAGTQSALPCAGCTVDSIAWYAANILAQNTIDGQDDYASTSVGQKTANAWGLYDMLGNVPEWVQDCYHNSY